MPGVRKDPPADVTGTLIELGTEVAKLTAVVEQLRHDRRPGRFRANARVLAILVAPIVLWIIVTATLWAISEHYYPSDSASKLISAAQATESFFASLSLLGVVIALALQRIEHRDRADEAATYEARLTALHTDLNAIEGGIQSLVSTAAAVHSVIVEATALMLATSDPKLGSNQATLAQRAIERAILQSENSKPSSSASQRGDLTS